MKYIITLLLAILCLSVGLTQTFQTVNSASSFTQQDIKKCINQVIHLLERDYIFSEKSTLIAKSLKYRLASNEFNQSIELGTFINEFDVLIRNVSGDSYLNIIDTNSHVIIDHQAHSKQNNSENFGFDKIEVLPGNIGYMKLNHFYQNPKAELQALKAFTYLTKTDAIIIDLRDVEGDSITLSQYMMSFFVEKNTTLTTMVYNKKHQTEILKSSKNLGFKHFKHNYPVYILTSAFLAGTGEFFSYTLQQLKKAVIVGEKTMGVAFISKKQKVNEFISINMPVAFPIHPVTNTNWEQEGVTPDFNVDANQSFDVAYKLAKDYLGIF